MKELPLTLKSFALYAGDLGSKLIVLLNWAKLLLKSSISFRKDMANTILNDISRFNSTDGKPTKEGLALAKELSDPKKYELIGFIPFISYIKVSGSSEAVKPVYIHPFGHYTLLFYKKKSCELVIVSPGIRFNESYLDQVPENGVVIGNVEGVVS